MSHSTDGSIPDDLFRDQATLETERLRLEPLGPEHFDGTWAGLQDPEGKRLTGTHTEFTQEQIRTWLESRKDAHDRADWAIILKADGVHVGEVVLNDLDADNRLIGFRIALAGPGEFGRGYGTEAARVVVDHAFDLGIHRIELEVVEFNERARRAYEKVGFVQEGVRREAWYWDGVYSDVITMAVIADGGARATPRPS